LRIPATNSGTSNNRAPTGMSDRNRRQFGGPGNCIGGHIGHIFIVA